MSVDGNDNTDVNSNNIIFTIKDTKLYIPAKDNQNFLVKDLKCKFIGMNMKQKLRIKIRQMNIDISSNQILLELIDLFQFIQIKMTMPKDLNSKILLTKGYCWRL